MRIRLHYIADDDLRYAYGKVSAADIAARPHRIVFDGDVDFGEYVADPQAIADVCFDRFNRHDSPTQHEALDRLELRSLSMGDVVEVVADLDAGRSAAFLVCTEGWEPVEGVNDELGASA